MLPNHQNLFPEIPSDTSTAALLVIRNGNFYLSIGRLVNSIFAQYDLRDQALRMSTSNEQHTTVQDIARLYLVTIFQFIEMLSDKQAVEALQMRVDWKYALHLPLDLTEQRYPASSTRRSMLSETVVCDFRHTLLDHPEYQVILLSILKRFSEITQAVKKPRLSGPGNEVVLQICMQNQLFAVWSQIRKVLRALAAWDPLWLSSIYQPQWYRRYGKSVPAFDTDYDGLTQVEAAQAIGHDCHTLIKAIANHQGAATDAGLQTLPEITALRELCEEQYEQSGDQLIWKSTACAKCRLLGRYPDQAGRTR